jgi:hypothetical protein
MEELRAAVTTMATVTIGDSTEQIEVELRPALMAQQCACCGLFFQMERGAGNQDAGRWHARMSGCPGRQGNGLFLSCCSMDCAAKLEAGAWKNPHASGLTTSEVQEYVDAGYGVVFSEFKSGRAMYEEELVARWEDTALAGPEDFNLTHKRSRIAVGFIG